nr:hypothetical protein [Rhodovulum sp.]
MTHAPPQPAQPACAARVQAKPMLGRPGDRFEQEADRIVDTVTADRPTPLTGPLPVTPLIQRQPDEEEKRKKEDEVQMKSTGGPAASAHAPARWAGTSPSPRTNTPPKPVRGGT